MSAAGALTTPPDGDGACVPAGLLYLDVQPAELRETSATARAARLESVAPCDSDGLHLVAAALPDGRTLVAGVEPDRLRAWLLAHPHRRWSLHPGPLPEGLADPPLPPDAHRRLDLLVGAFEPAPRRRLRLAFASIAAGALLAVAGLAVVGAEQRWLAARQAQGRVAAELRAQVAAALPELASDDPRLALAQELRRLSAQDPAAAQELAVDLGPLLDDLSAAWPAGQRIETSTLTIGRDRVVLRARMRNGEEAERLAARLSSGTSGTLAGRRWRAAPPTVTPRGDESADVVVVLDRGTGGS